MKKSQSAGHTYKKIIKRRNAYRYFISLSIVGLIILGSFVEENTVLFMFGVFGVVFVGWSLVLNFTMCPKCYGNFFGVKYTSKGTAIISNNLFSTKKCNNCDYCGE